MNVSLDIPNGGLIVPPDVIANSGHPSPIFERGYNREIRMNAELPGPGTSIHIVFNSGINAQGQPVILPGAKVHADIGNTEDVVGIVRHTLADVIAAAIQSRRRGGCAVKFD
jgi:hypothetical protein